MIIKSDLLCVGGAGEDKALCGTSWYCTCPVNASKDAHEMTFTATENASLIKAVNSYVDQPGPVLKFKFKSRIFKSA